MSANHTSKYGLCQWEPGDYVTHGDFNADNLIIDAELGALADDIEALSGSTSSALGTVSSSVSSLGSRVDSLESSVASLGTLPASVSSLDGRVDSLESSVASLGTLPASVSSLDTRVDSLEATSKSTSATVSSHTGSISTLTTNLNTLTATVSNGVKIAAGSYTGTGKYGASNKNSLTFSFVPKLVFITGLWGSGESNRWSNTVVLNPASGVYGSTGAEFAYTGNVSISGKTVSWYTNHTWPGTQGDISGETYYWVAVG